MKILITGGTGLIGLAFIQRFGGCQITVLTRSISTGKAILPPSVKLIGSLENHLCHLKYYWYSACLRQRRCHSLLTYWLQQPEAYSPE